MITPRNVSDEVERHGVKGTDILLPLLSWVESPKNTNLLILVSKILSRTVPQFVICPIDNNTNRINRSREVLEGSRNIYGRD